MSSDLKKELQTDILKAVKPKTSGMQESSAVPEDEGISGNVEEIIYRNDLNGYTVLNLETDGSLISAVGILPEVGEGDSLNVWGSWEQNAKYGKQFHITVYRINIPTASADLYRYLASGAIKGIGQKTAKRIIDTFGEDAADVIDNHPEYLSQIQGISLKRAKEISGDYASKAALRNVLSFFRDYFGPSATMKIYRQFGSKAVDTAKNAPYRLCDEVEGISFEAADSFARGIGVPENAPERISSGIEYVLSVLAAREGHTCLPEDRLIQEAADRLKVDTESVSSAVRAMVLERRLCADKKENEETLIFTRQMYDDEKYIAKKLLRLSTGSVRLDFSDMQGLMTKAEAENGISYDDDQKRAIYSALSRGVLVLTGGPGTGKTTVITALIGMFESLGMKVALCAPTGRAAKRMTEATGYEAKTVHRLLEVSISDAASGADKKGADGTLLDFRRNEGNPLIENAIIIDEVSMLDTPLTAAILRAVRPGSRLVLIGDADQLPSVGAGNILHDLISSGALPVVALRHIFRQAGQSLIVTNAHAINEGRMPDLSATDRDFFFLSRGSDADIVSTVADLVARRLPKAYGNNENIQVISPSRKSASGTEALNRVIRELVNPHAPGRTECRHGDSIFRTGDRVMQVRNNYEAEWTQGVRSGQGIFNGDIGRILNVNMQSATMDIDFEGRRVIYPFRDLDDLEPAYAITVHKSQGSEYSTLVIALGSVPPMLRTRNLLYTAVTRAQKRVIIVGYAGTVSEMAANSITQPRFTGLDRRLAAAQES